MGDAIRLEEYGASNQLELIPALFAVSELPRVVVNQDEIRRFLDGQFLKFHDAAARTTLTKNAKSVVAVDQEQRLIAILERFDANNFKPKLNFAHYWQSV